MAEQKNYPQTQAGALAFVEDLETAWLGGPGKPLLAEAQRLNAADVAAEERAEEEARRDKLMHDVATLALLTALDGKAPSPPRAGAAPANVAEEAGALLRRWSAPGPEQKPALVAALAQAGIAAPK